MNDKVVTLGIIGLGVVLVIGIGGMAVANIEAAELERRLDDITESLDEAELAVSQARLDIRARDAEIETLREVVAEKERELEWLRLQLAATPAPLTEPLPLYTPTPTPDPIVSAEPTTIVAPTGSDCNVNVTECWFNGVWICGPYDGVSPCTLRAQCAGHEHECFLHCNFPMECYGEGVVDE